MHDKKWISIIKLPLSSLIGFVFHVAVVPQWKFIKKKKNHCVSIRRDTNISPNAQCIENDFELKHTAFTSSVFGIPTLESIHFHVCGELRFQARNIWNKFSHNSFITATVLGHNNASLECVFKSHAVSYASVKMRCLDCAFIQNKKVQKVRWARASKWHFCLFCSWTIFMLHTNKQMKTYTLRFLSHVWDLHFSESAVI